jgi:hypothetical protein
MLVPSSRFQRQNPSQTCFSGKCRHPCFYSRAPSVCLAIPGGELGRGVFEGITRESRHSQYAYSRGRTRVDLPSDDLGSVDRLAPRRRCVSVVGVDENGNSAVVYESTRWRRRTDPLNQDASPRTEVSPSHPKRSASTATLVHLASTLGSGTAPLRTRSRAKRPRASRHWSLSRHSKHMPELHETAPKTLKMHLKAPSCLG